MRTCSTRTSFENCSTDTWERGPCGAAASARTDCEEGRQGGPQVRGDGQERKVGARVQRDVFSMLPLRQRRTSGAPTRHCSSYDARQGRLPAP